jgi:hypothetical protein
MAAIIANAEPLPEVRCGTQGRCSSEEHELLWLQSPRENTESCKTRQLVPS